MFGVFHFSSFLSLFFRHSSFPTSSPQDTSWNLGYNTDSRIFPPSLCLVLPTPSCLTGEMVVSGSFILLVGALTTAG